MNTKSHTWRRPLVWVLLAVLLIVPFGGFSAIEMVLWAVLLVGWFWLLLVWSAPPSSRRDEAPGRYGESG